MYRKSLAIAALALFAAGASTAAGTTGEATPDYPKAYSSSLTRAQVRAETLEAIRLGVIARGEQSVLPTAAQLESIRVAGERARSMMLASR